MPDTNERASQHSLDAWVRDTWPRAVAYARSLLRDPVTAEDVVQDCYVALLKKADEYDLLRDGLKLLMKSVSNACLKHRTRARPMVSLSSHSPGDEADVDVADDGGVEPPRAVLDAELGRAVETGLARLTPVQRAAVELKALGHSLQEIAEILDVTPSNAGVLVHRGRQELARQLAPFLEDTTG